VEQVVRIRLMHVRAMVERAAKPSERQAVISQRVANVLMSTLVVSGHPSITQTQVRSETSDVLGTVDQGHKRLEKKSEFVIDASGASLMDLAVADFVDWTRCYTNDILDVQQTLGISAAAEVLYYELREVISFDGTYIFPGHLQLIVDTMCRDGKIKPLSRFGVNREHSNVLARATYEEPPDILAEAAIFGEETPAVGVSTSITLGQHAAVGTGMVDARFASAMLPQKAAALANQKTRIFKSVVRPTNRGTVNTCIEYVEPAEASSHTPLDVQYCANEDDNASGGVVFDAAPPEEMAFVLHSPEQSEDEGE